MANIKSAKKRILTAERNHERNVIFKSTIKSAVKSVLALAQAKEKDQEAIKAALSKAYKLCDQAASKGILHTASRKKSRLTRAVNKLMA